MYGRILNRALNALRPLLSFTPSSHDSPSRDPSSSHDSPSRDPQQLYQLCLLLAFVLCLRSIALFVDLSSLRDDPDAYLRLAGNLARAGVLGIESSDGLTVTPSAFRPPLYPWLLSRLADGDGNIPAYLIATLHLLLGVGTIWLVWSIAKQLKIPWPWLPALLVTLDPLLLRASQLVMTETLAAFLAVLAWRLWLAVYPTERAEQRTLGQWLLLFGLGCTFGLSVLARPTAGPWVALCALGLLFVACSCWKRRVNDCLMVSLLVSACLAPWILRNVAVIGKPIWATTHGGYTLLLANNPMIYEHFQRSGPSRQWDAEPFHQRWASRYEAVGKNSPAEHSFWLEPLSASTSEPNWNEADDDALAYSAAWNTIARQPLMFALSSMYRVGWLWSPWPLVDSIGLRLVIGGWYALMFALAIVGLRQGNWACGRQAWLRVWWLPLALVLSLTLIHAVFWSNMRMRAPAMAAIYVAASMALPRNTRPPTAGSSGIRQEFRKSDFA